VRHGGSGREHLEGWNESDMVSDRCAVDAIYQALIYYTRLLNVLFDAVLYCAILSFTVLCCTTLCYTILCYTTLY
jgi:hypothetical protein